MNNNQIELNENLVKREVYACVSPLVESILEIGQDCEGAEHKVPFVWDDVENLYRTPDCECEDKADCDCEAEPQEVYEWWAVSPWLYEQLREQGEPVIDTFPHLWGRTTTGQAIACDGVITRIQQASGYGGGAE